MGRQKGRLVGNRQLERTQQPREPLLELRHDRRHAAGGPGGGAQLVGVREGAQRRGAARGEASASSAPAACAGSPAATRRPTGEHRLAGQVQLRQHGLAARDPQALQTARGLEARDGTRKLHISRVDLDDVVVQAEDRATPRFVGQQPQALAVRGDLDIGALEMRSELARVMCERGHADVEWQPLDQGLQLGLVVERAKRGRPAVHHLGEPAVLRLAGPGLEVAASGDRGDRIEVTVADPHVVMHDEALARLVAKVPDRHARERRIPTELALQHERHRIRVEQCAHLRQRGVARRPDPRGRHGHVGRGRVANVPQVAGKLLRRTLTRDAPVCHLDHAIRGTRERRRMGDHDRGTPAHQRIEAFHHCRLALGVETGRRLVEHEDRRVAQDRAGNRDPLTLAARETDPSLPEHGRIAVGELLDELMGGRSLGRGDDLLRIRLDAIRDVVRDRAREEDALLQHEPDLVANPAQPALAQIVPVDQHAPVERVVEPGDQRRERRLAGTRAADHRNALAGGDEERESVQRRALAVVAEDHAVELDLAGGATSVVAVRRVVEHVVGREDLGHAIGPRERLRDPAPLARDCAERTVDLPRIHDHDRQQAELEIAAVNAVRRRPRARGRSRSRWRSRSSRRTAPRGERRGCRRAIARRSSPRAAPARTPPTRTPAPRGSPRAPRR